MKSRTVLHTPWTACAAAALLALAGCAANNAGTAQTNTQTGSFAATDQVRPTPGATTTLGGATPATATTAQGGRPTTGATPNVTGVSPQVSGSGAAPATRDWAQVDTNRDGSISPDEMSAYLQANPGPLQQQQKKK